MYDQAQQDRLRKLWRLYHDRHAQAVERYQQALDEWEYPMPEPVPHYPPFPEVLRGLTCGAKTRKGTPCKNKTLYRSGRCKFHGGMSTGPKSKKGKQMLTENSGKSEAHEDL